LYFASLREVIFRGAPSVCNYGHNPDQPLDYFPVSHSPFALCDLLLQFIITHPIKNPAQLFRTVQDARGMPHQQVIVDGV